MPASPRSSKVEHVPINRQVFLADRQGRRFGDVLLQDRSPFSAVLVLLNSPHSQRRMMEAELHHDRAPLAGVVRELEALPEVEQFFLKTPSRASSRFRQAVGVAVRIIMERQGWKKTGKKGSLGVRRREGRVRLSHNTGGLAFWFLRAERYTHDQLARFPTVQERRDRLPTSAREKKTPPRRAGRSRARNPE